MSIETEEEDLEKSSDRVTTDLDWGRNQGGGDEDSEVKALELGLQLAGNSGGKEGGRRKIKDDA